MTGNRKLLWAVDAFADEHKTQLVAFRVLDKFAEATGAVIEPVSVLCPEDLRVPKHSFEGFSQEYRREAEKRLERWIGKIKSPRRVPPRLLLQPKLSLASTVEVFLRYAQECGAELIGVGTTTRSAVERFFLGSFAETMMLKSSIPLLIANPTMPAAPTLKRALFATDLSESSRTAFATFLPTAKALGARVVLYTKGEFAMPTEGIPVMALSSNYRDYLQPDTEARAQHAQKWIDEASRAGVKATLIVDEKLGTTSAGIIAAAKREKVGLIALAARSGPVASAMLGSVSRQVVRRAPIPVWALHPK